MTAFCDQPDDIRMTARRIIDNAGGWPELDQDKVDAQQQNLEKSKAYATAAGGQ